jgi:hypothetical protein
MFEISGTTIRVTKGDTAIITFSCSNYTLASGDTVYFSVKKYISDTAYKLQKIITSFTDGVAQIELSGDDTDLTAGNYKYDIQCTLADGRIDTVIGPAIFTVLEEVTAA